MGPTAMFAFLWRFVERLKGSPKGHASLPVQQAPAVKSDFESSFRHVLQRLPINKIAVLIIESRFLQLLKMVKRKHRKTMISYNLHRLTILLSGLIVPALIGVENEVPNRSAIFWMLLIMSLLGSVSNAWMEFFSIVKLHYSYLAISETLEAEGWYFLSLSGPYYRYRRHDQCWKIFIHNVEQIQASGVNQYMLNSQPANTPPSGKDLMQETGVEDFLRNRDGTMARTNTSKPPWEDSQPDTHELDVEGDFNPHDFVIDLNKMVS